MLVPDFAAPTRCASISFSLSTLSLSRLILFSFDFLLFRLVFEVVSGFCFNELKVTACQQLDLVVPRYTDIIENIKYQGL